MLYSLLTRLGRGIFVPPLLLSFAATTGFAQTSRYPAYLSCEASSDGKAKLRLGFTLDSAIAPFTKAQIERVLGGSLKEEKWRPDGDDSIDDPDSDAADESDDSSTNKPTDRLQTGSKAALERHTYTGDGQQLLSKSGSMVDGTIDLSTLLLALKEGGCDSLTVQVNHPAGGYNYVPPGNQLPQTPSWVGRSFYSYKIDLGNISADRSSLRIVFGYERNSWLIRLAILGVLFWAPIVMAIRRRLQSKRPGNVDPTSVRYGALKAVNAMALFYPILWYITYSLLGMKGMIEFATPTGASRLSIVSVNLAARIVPPVFSLMLCSIVLAPVLDPKETRHKRSHTLARRLTIEVLGKYLPFLYLLAGIDAAVQRQYTAFAGFVVAGQLTRVMIKSSLAKQVKDAIYPLVTGSLRARADELATRAGVVPREIFVLSEKASKTANACATAKQTIVLNEFLINRFTKREVDSVIAHELGHLRLNHVRYKQGVLYGGIVFCLMASSVLSMTFGIFALIFRPILKLIPYIYSSNVTYYVLIGILLLFLLFLSRRFEESADSFAVTLTGDPEAMITTLAKLARLNMLPMTWPRFDGGFFSHPSSHRRIKAISHRYGIPDNYVESLITRVDSHDDRYSLTDTDAGSASEPAVYAVAGRDTAPYAATPVVRTAPRRKKGLKVLVPFKNVPFVVVGSFLLLGPGGIAERLNLGTIGLSSYGAALLAGLFMLTANCVILKRKVLRAYPKSIRLRAVTPDTFPHLDKNLLARRTAELRALGFHHEADYTTDSASQKQFHGFARLFIHPINGCVAELIQVVTASRPATPMTCSITSYLREGWAYSTSNREPNAQMHVKARPRNLFHLMPGASPAELLDRHIRFRSELTSSLNVGIVDPSLYEHAARMGDGAAQRRWAAQKTPILIHLALVDRFERNPKSEWLGDFEKRRGQQAPAGTLDYKRT